MKIVSIVGARPQFIKLAPLVAALQHEPELKHVICHTGQHYDWQMSQVFFDELGIPKPQYHFSIEATEVSKIFSEMLAGIVTVIQKEKPNWVLVFGDTYSTLAGTLAARFAGVKLAHVEAGVRSFNKVMPEEFNRVTADHAADLLLCTHQNAIHRLKAEGIECPAVLCGDLMKDTLKLAQASLAQQKESNNLALAGNDYLLVTIHRKENQQPEKIKTWVALLNHLAENYKLVFPIHPSTAAKLDNSWFHENIQVIEPVGYMEMVQFISRSRCVLTDSGGLQKDAYYLNKPCITLRTETEWTELVDMGVNTVVGLDMEKAKRALEKFENNELNFDANPYGDGQSAEKIINALKRENL